MTRFVLRRVGLAVLTVWGVATLVFLMTKLIPGDAARVAAGRTATAEQIEAARQRLGLDRPMVEQYLHYLGGLLHGDLGWSASTKQPVAVDLQVAFPVTLQLVLVAMVFTVVVAIPLGTFAALRHGSAADAATRLVAILGGGVPVFWLALVLQWLFAVRLGWTPISGANGYGLDPPVVTGATLVDSLLAGSPQMFADSAAHLVLPALALSAPFLAVVVRNVRSTMLGVLGTDYASFAVAKGVTTWRLVVRHALPAAASSTLTILGMQLGFMLGAALLVEAVFAMPGLGTYLYTAILNQDTFAVLGGVLVTGAVFVLAGLVVDLIQMAIDPRVRSSHLAHA
ncbi:peptide ABC transporter permease [Luteimicrobium album]|uniref:Peptide ABC transporter permease n=1 Tax=Luteimicrobium album TaxID=1054550 RepID=A0ABQ6I0Y8_9MICO|nr:ABC transporter permease [Luteimicrobium album]GMA24112.1 peptide ABC transporter permease [Luteimicrobium album]